MDDDLQGYLEELLLLVLDIIFTKILKSRIMYAIGILYPYILKYTNYKHIIIYLNYFNNK